MPKKGKITSRSQFGFLFANKPNIAISMTEETEENIGRLPYAVRSITSKEAKKLSKEKARIERKKARQAAAKAKRKTAKTKKRRR